MRFKIKSIFNILFILIISVFISVQVFYITSAVIGDDSSDFTFSELSAYNQSNIGEIQRNNQNMPFGVPGKIIWEFFGLFISLLLFCLLYFVEKDILINFNSRAPPLQLARYY